MLYGRYSGKVSVRKAFVSDAGRDGPEPWMFLMFTLCVGSVVQGLHMT
jgi:hypothetical protein